MGTFWDFEMLRSLTADHNIEEDKEESVVKTDSQYLPRKVRN